ncbi:MAG: hypothetical protein MUF22_07235 [Chitinispirillaceae bacterium]|jgi:hypothetical protein|nr:hypothetical protein [Chitinispirillaceae bacterium]
MRRILFGILCLTVCFCLSCCHRTTVKKDYSKTYENANQAEQELQKAVRDTTQK